MFIRKTPAYSNDEPRKCVLCVVLIGILIMVMLAPAPVLVGIVNDSVWWAFGTLVVELVSLTAFRLLDWRFGWSADNPSRFDP